MDDRDMWESRIRGLEFIGAKLNGSLKDLGLQLTPVRDLEASYFEKPPERLEFEDPLLQRLDDARRVMVGALDSVGRLQAETAEIGRHVKRQRIALRQREALVDHIANLAEENQSLRTLLREKL